MKKRMKKLGCLLLALSMSCQTTALAAAPAGCRPDIGKSQPEKAAQKTAEPGKQESPYVVLAEETAQPQSKGVEEKRENVLPPQMGWSSWNCFRQNIDENKIRQAAQSLIDSGLNEHGYVYLNMDDCWQSSMRDENGRMQFDPTAFPSGPAFIKELNAMAGEDSSHPLKVGLYSSSGNYTCEDLTASYGHEEADAQTFAEWGVEYLKYDYCHVVDMDVDSGYITDAPEVDYITVAKANTPETVKYEAEKADLEGNASKQDWYVTGLNKGGGAVVFKNLEVPEDGRYVLTIGFRKTYSKGKYAEIVVNDSTVYETSFAPTSGWSNTGRQQMYVDLKKGANKIKIHNPIKGQKEDSIRRYTKMGNALKAATAKVAADTKTSEKPVFYSVCEHGRTQPWTWAQDFASSWRVSGDINSSWDTIVSKYDIAAKLWDYQQPGSYNDPDMLEVGNGSLNKEENKSHFTLWCMLSAPLILGNDVRSFVKQDGTIDHEACNGAYDIVTNQELIDINQSWPLQQCKRVSQANNVDILVKPLDDQEIAVCFFNRGSVPATAEYDLDGVKTDDSRAKLPAAGAYAAADLWDEELTETIIPGVMSSGEIPAHGVKAYRVRAARAGEADRLTSFSFEAEKLVNTGEVFQVHAEVKNMGTTSMKDMDVTLELPQGFRAKKTSTNGTGLTTGKGETFTWEVTAPSSGADGSIRAALSFRYDKETEVQTKSFTKEISAMEEPADELVLGDMDWISAKDGWKSQPARNKSIGGKKISIGGVTYDSGVGTNSESEIKVYLGGKNYRFTAVAGIDDEAIEDYNQTGSDYQPPQVTYELWADGVNIYDSGLVNLENPKAAIDVTIEDCRELLLRITEGGNTNSYDHADWADARFVNLGEITKYSIAVEECENGTIVTNPQGSVMEGGKVEITFLPDQGYQVEKALVNGSEVTLTDGTYILEHVAADVTVSAVFAKESDIKNIALTARASSPAKTAANSGPEMANNDDVDVTKNGFAISEGQDESVRYLQYDWEEPQDIESLEYMTSYGFVRGAEECTILISYDGESFEKLTDWTGMEWKENDNIIESNRYQLTEDEKDRARNVKAMRVVLTKTKYAWGATVIMELAVMGKKAAKEAARHTVQMVQPSGGSIQAEAAGSALESGDQAEEGISVTFTFRAKEGYTLKKAWVNDKEAALSDGNIYIIESLNEDVTARAEFEANTITGSIDLSAAGVSPEGIAVILTGTTGEKSWEAPAKADGSYVFSEVPYGTYTVKIRETALYTAETVTVELSGQTARAGIIKADRKPEQKPDPDPDVKPDPKPDPGPGDSQNQQTAPGIARASAKSIGYRTVEIKWNQVKDASGYEVYRKYKTGAWTVLKDVGQKRSFQDTKAVTGRKYQYAVKAYGMVDGKKNYGGLSKAVTGKALPAAPRVTSRAYKKAGNKITWKKVAGAQKYIIYRKKSGKKAKWVRLKTVKAGTRSYVDRKAGKGKPYYYAVKASRKADGKTYLSNYGISKKVK